MIISHMFDRARRPLTTLLAALALAVIWTASAQAQKAYKSPEEAVEALVKAGKADDMKAILAVLGEDGEDIVSSGDSVEDANLRKKFLDAYEAKHSIKTDGDKATVIVGNDDFPFPIPIVKQGGTWKFDTEAGREEILARRIGRNELDVIQTMLAYVDAQNEYAEQDRGDGVGVYAQRIISRPGKKDGLYWPSSGSADESPLGEFAAKATAQGYSTKGKGERQPYHGYYYKILTRQGPRANGGEQDYVVHGKMIGGFGLVAWPAEYGNSGIMTFMVNHEGKVYEKDLGERTDRVAPRISAYNPDNTWKESDTTAAAR